MADRCRRGPVDVANLEGAKDSTGLSAADSVARAAGRWRRSGECWRGRRGSEACPVNTHIFWAIFVVH